MSTYHNTSTNMTETTTESILPTRNSVSTSSGTPLPSESTSGITLTAPWIHSNSGNDLKLIIPLCVATGIVSCIIIGLCCFMKRNNLMPSFNRGGRRSMNVRPSPTSQPHKEAPVASVLTLQKRHSISAPDLHYNISSYPAYITTKQKLIQIRSPAEKVPNKTEYSTDDLNLVDTRLTQNETFTKKGKDANKLGQELNMVTLKPNPITKTSDPQIYQSVQGSGLMKSDDGQFATIGKRRLPQARVGQVQLTRLWDQKIRPCPN